MKFGWMCFLFLALIGCKSNRGVNEAVVLPLVTVNAVEPHSTTQAFNDYMSRSPVAAISGILYLNGELPTPLVRVQVALFQKEASKWKEVGRISTETGGVFSFTRSLPAGEYEVRVVDSRFTGQLPVTLTSSPRQDLVLMAERVKK